MEDALGERVWLEPIMIVFEKVPIILVLLKTLKNQFTNEDWFRENPSIPWRFHPKRLVFQWSILWFIFLDMVSLSIESTNSPPRMFKHASCFQCIHHVGWSFYFPPVYPWATTVRENLPFHAIGTHSSRGFAIIALFNGSRTKKWEAQALPSSIP